MDTIKKNLRDQLLAWDLAPQMLDKRGESTDKVDDAVMLSFDFQRDGRNYGTVVMYPDGQGYLQVFYSDPRAQGWGQERHRDQWFDLLDRITRWARTNMSKGSKLQDLSKLHSVMQDMQQVSGLRESLNIRLRPNLLEAYYGGRRTSYQDHPNQVRIRIEHDQDIAEGQARHRHIRNIYIETALGERFRVPTRSLRHARVLARHAMEGGTPYDAFGNHINNIVNEINVVRRFLRAVDDRDLGLDAARLAQQGREIVEQLRQELQEIGTRRGYHRRRNAWQPVSQRNHGQTLESMRNMFRNGLDQRIEEALPVLARLAVPAIAQSLSSDILEEFDSWTQGVIEQADLGDIDSGQQRRLTELLSSPLAVGTKGMGAIPALQAILDPMPDTLQDSLLELAQDQGAEADAAPLIRGWLESHGIELSDIRDQTPGNTNSAPDTSAPADAASDASRPTAAPVPGTTAMVQELDTDGVMRTVQSNMSSESINRDLHRLRFLSGTQH